MASLYKNEAGAKAEIVSRNCAVVVSQLSILSFEIIWNTFDLWTRTAFGCCEHALIDFPSRNVKTIVFKH